MKSPAFQFYVQDFLIGTSHFSAEETGAYIRLLCHQWDNGLVENDEQKLKKISGISVKKMGKILKKFSKTKDGHYKNLRLEKERKKQADLRKRRSDAGKKGNEIKYGSRKANANGSHCDRNAFALQSSSSSSTSVNKTVGGASREETFFYMFRRCSGDHITDEELKSEVGKFLNKYPNLHPNQGGPLVNAWVSRIGEEPPKKKQMVI